MSHQNQKVHTNPDGSTVALPPDVIVGQGTTLHNVKFSAPVAIGARCTISNTLLVRCEVKDDATVENSTVVSARIHPRSQIIASTVRHCTVAGVMANSQMIVGHVTYGTHLVCTLQSAQALLDVPPFARQQANLLREAFAQLEKNPADDNAFRGFIQTLEQEVQASSDTPVEALKAFYYAFDLTTRPHPRLLDALKNSAHSSMVPLLKHERVPLARALALVVGVRL